MKTAFYIGLSLLCRLGMLVTLPLFFFGCKKPIQWFAIYTYYFDDRAIKAWEGEL